MDAANRLGRGDDVRKPRQPVPVLRGTAQDAGGQGADRTYVVTGYQELLALAHDPRVSSDIRRARAGSGRRGTPTPNRWRDPIARPTAARAQHHRLRPARTRPDAPPGACATSARRTPPDLIPGMEPLVVRLADDLLDKVKARGGTRTGRRGGLRLPDPGRGDLPDPGRSDRRRADVPRVDLRLHDGQPTSDPRPTPTRAARWPRSEAASTAALMRYLGDLVEQYASAPGAGCCRRCCTTTGRTGRCRRPRPPTNAMLLLVAGHDSTVNTITNA